MCFAVALIILLVALAIPAAPAPKPILQNNGIQIPISRSSSPVDPNEYVDFDALDSHLALLKIKIMDGFDVYQMNTGTAHPSAVKETGIQKRDGAGLALTGYRQRIWYGTVSIGTPAMDFTVRLDTAASRFFVPSSTCGPSCDGHTRWNTEKSTSARPIGRKFEAKFADGDAVLGDVYTDNVTIAGFTADKQAIGAATTYSTGLHKDICPSDGFLGMAFHNLSPGKHNTLFETLVEEKRVVDQVFSIKLTPTGGELFIGGKNDGLYDGEITFTTVTRQGSSNFAVQTQRFAHISIQAYWQVEMQKLEGNGKTLLSGVDAIIDTGASVIAGNPNDVKEIYNKIGGKPHPNRVGYYTFPCEDFPNLRLSLTFGGRPFPISPSYINRGRVKGSPADCVCGIIGLDSGASFWVIGDVFLQGVYSVFDVGNLQVGFARLR